MEAAVTRLVPVLAPWGCDLPGGLCVGLFPSSLHCPFPLLQFVICVRGQASGKAVKLEEKRAGKGSPRQGDAEQLRQELPPAAAGASTPHSARPRCPSPALASSLWPRAGEAAWEDGCAALLGG